MSEERSYSFDGVKPSSELELTMPGTIGVFGITKVEFGESKDKKTPYMKHTYTLEQILNDKGELVPANKPSTFNHSYYLSSEAAMGRVQYLHKVLYDTEMTGTINQAQLIAKFQDKKIGLKVTGQVGDNGKGYPDLIFAGFAKKPTEVKELKFTAQEEGLNARAIKAMVEGAPANADRERRSTTDNPAPTSMNNSGGF